MDTNNYERYLEILGIKDLEPSYTNLKQIIQSHLMKIPFENISKLYYLKTLDLKYIPDFNQYLDGIQQYNLGGTCYTTNYYLHELLKFLGYDVDLCGADMKSPDVHIANIVLIDSIQYIIDVGFSAPFLEPIPRLMSDMFKIKTAKSKYYTVKTVNNEDVCTLYHESKNNYTFDYKLKLHPRNISNFKDVIRNSFKPNSHFMNNLLISRFGLNYSKKINNFSFEEYNGMYKENIELNNAEKLPYFLETQFQIPAVISNIALQSVSFSSNQ